MTKTGSTDLEALGLNLVAGLSTCIGGLIVLHRRLVHLANPSSLGLALGVSAGVMIFISLVEIFTESVDNFKKVLGCDDEKIFKAEFCKNNFTSLVELSNVHVETIRDTLGCEKGNINKTICDGNSWSLATVFFIIGCGIIFLMDLIVHKISPEAGLPLDVDELDALRHSATHLDSTHRSDSPEILRSRPMKKSFDDTVTKQALNRTGILTALAIAIHNLPEGIAIYMGARNEKKLGIELAISIALHNIPEGIAVATPVYFATGSRLKAFLWTFLSALAEPLGGVLCWLIIGGNLNPMVNGIMFGLVVGMMMTISVKELLPTAHRFCQSKDKLATSIIVGMCVMALSLIVFAYVGL